MQIAQTDGMVALGVATICGIVKEVRTNEFYIVACDDGKTRRINACCLNYVPDEMYERWKRNGVNTAKGLTRNKISYELSPYIGEIEETLRYCCEVTKGE